MTQPLDNFGTMPTRVHAQKMGHGLTTTLQRLKPLASYSEDIMKFKPLMDADYLRSIMDYSSETGVFTWRHRDGVSRRTNMRFAGKESGSTRGDGYVIICIDYKSFMAHRLAWRWMTGDDPVQEIDHIDGNTSNNRFSNLRIVTHAQNIHNSARFRKSTSGVKGVSWDKRDSKWVAHICVSGKQTSLGYYSTIEAAADAYKAAAIKHFGQFMRLA